MKNLSKLLNAGFLLLVGALLLGGLAKAALRPAAVNAYENRPANYLHKPDAAGVLDSTYQDSVEKALSDQVPLAQRMKKAYNDGSSRLAFSLLAGFLESRPQRYVSLRGIKTFGGDYLVYSPRRLDDVRDSLDEKARGLNALMEAHPGLDFYAYYIEKDTDINFETGEKNGVYEYLSGLLNLPDGHMARFQIDSFEEFRQAFYRTDHHWKHTGSYQGYTEVARLLGVDEPLLEPLEEVLLPYTFSGSKAAGAGAAEVFREEFPVYRFDYPEMAVTLNGEPAEDYGQQAACFAGELDAARYGTFYGTDAAEAVFDTGREDRGNLLIFGESYDNAILKLLASHYHKTCAVDLRYYGDLFGDFDFSGYVQEQEIDTVLFIGNIDYYIMAEFLPEG